jgi:superfamily II DNA or RNA helicase
MVWVPYPHLTKRTATALMKRLTVTPKKFQRNEPDPLPIKQYVNDRENQRFGMPVDFGLRWLTDMRLIDDLEIELSRGHPITVRRLPDPYHPSASKGQDKFMVAMLAAAKKLKPFLAYAQTRTGKTPVSLNTVGKLLRTTLVVVGSTYLAKQWREEAELHLGLRPDEIGMIGEGIVDWEGRSLVTAVVHNLADGKFPAEMYRYFGIGVWDEVHRLGAPMFARTIKQFPCAHRWGMSATPQRKDGCGQIFLDQFGDPAVISTAEAISTICYVLPYYKKGSRYGKSCPLSILLNLIAKDEERNQLIAHTIDVMYNKNRQIVCVSDRVGHLELLLRMSADAGIPEDRMGLFTRQYTDADGIRQKHSQEDLDRVRDNAQIIFATYGMFKEGIDIPRLDAGIDATPRAEGTQMIGRVRTPMEGKPLPAVWFTIKDEGVPRLLRSCDARLNDYRAHGIEVIDGTAQT